MSGETLIVTNVGGSSVLLAMGAAKYPTMHKPATHTLPRELSCPECHSAALRDRSLRDKGDAHIEFLRSCQGTRVVILYIACKPYINVLHTPNTITERVARCLENQQGVP